MKPQMLSETRIYFVQKCVDCGKTFRLAKDSKETRCYKCRTKLRDKKYFDQEQERRKKIEETNNSLIGSTVVHVKGRTSSNELASMEIKTANGKIIELTSIGYEDDHYIEWEEKEME
jgi:DNA-directed RNA polymerase subunit RPC12/RpoP